MNESNKINLALKEFSYGNKEIAYKKLKKIFKNNKNDDQLRFNIAVIEQTLNLNEEAIINYKYLIKKDFNLKAIVNLYLIHMKEDDYNQAIELINLIQGENITETVLKDKAFVLYKLKRNDESIRICEAQLKINNDINYINILGLNYLSKNLKEKAEKVFKIGLKIDSANPIILNSLGRMYHERRDSKNAEKFLLSAYNIKKDSYEIINNLAGFYREEGKYRKSINLYNEALKINPKNPSIINNLAKAYFDIDDLVSAKKYCKNALALNNNDGNIQKILSLIYLKEHDYKKGWVYFDGRLKLTDFEEKNSSISNIRNKLLLKNELNKNSKILVIREQGVGDEILYGTMYPDLLKSFENVTIECDDRLKEIFQNSIPNKIDTFVTLDSISKNKDQLDKYDYVIYAGSLGRFFRKDLKEFTGGNYLNANDNLLKKSKNTLNNLSGSINIGISWKSFKNRYSAEKSLILDDFKEIFNLENCNFINLQYGDVKTEIKKFNDKFKKKIISIKNLDLFNDFNNLAAYLKNMDLFITVSNSTAHLAGSLGVKTLLIKPNNHALFHYWNQSNTKTPWYKSVTLINRKDLLKGRTLLEGYLNC